MNRTNQIKLLISLVLFGLSVFLFSLGVQQYQVLTSTRAEYDGTYCNDDAGDSIPGSFNINCGGNLNRNYKYVLFYCPNLKAGASYCGDIRDMNSAQVLTQSEGASIPASISGSVDKTCGCAQWDVGVYDSSGQIGVAGGAIMCAQNSCEQPTNTPAPTTPPADNPTNTPAPTTPPNEPTNTPVPTTPPGEPTNTPAPTNTVAPTNSPTPTNTPTTQPTNTPIPTATLTPIPTNTPIPTATFTPAPTFTLAPTFTPQPTYAPQPTYTPQPTQVAQVIPTATPITQLVVNDQPPGMTPWLLVLVPIGLVLVGLFL